MDNKTVYFEEDILLLQKLKSGQKEALKQIFNLYWDVLYNTACSKLDSKAEAREIVQNIFINLWDTKENLIITSLSDHLFSTLKHSILVAVRNKLSAEKRIGLVDSENF